MVAQKQAEPSFIVAGGVRCATGWIRQCLKEHPEVYMPQRETHFFDQNYAKGKPWYMEFFKDHADEKAVGEKTAAYMHDELVPERIKETLPDVKIILCLRDPVERMYSHYSMAAAEDEALQATGFMDSMKPGTKYVESGKYGEQLQRFLEALPPENVLVTFYEDKDRDPYGFIEQMYRFIGVDPSFKAPSAEIRTKQGKLEHNNRLWGTLSRVMLHPRAPFFFRSLYTGIRPEERGELDDEAYRRLSAYYAEDLPLLEKLTGRDLTIWRTRRVLKG